MRTHRFVAVAAALSTLLLAGAAAAPAAASVPALSWHGSSGHPHSSDYLAWSRFDNFQDGTARIVVSDRHGRQVTALSHPPTGSQDINPEISPDGQQILFERDLPDTSQIWLMNADGSGERLVDVGCTDPCVGIGSPSWTPSGTSIVYTRVFGPFTAVNDSAVSAVLWTADISGQDSTRLSVAGIDGAYEEYNASYAPGGYIVFLRVRNADIHSAVFRMRPDGSGLRQLTPWSIDADLPHVSPASSGPTRDRVVFETFGHGAGADPTEGQAVATVNARCVTDEQCAASVRYLTPRHELPTQSFNPAWSPDGRSIAYVRFVGSTATTPAVGDIWTMRYDGTHNRAVSLDPRFEFRPAWGAVAR